MDAVAALEAYVLLCRAVAARCCPPRYPDFEDWCEEALIVAWQGLAGYDPTKAGSLRRYVLLCARRKMLDMLKACARRREECLLDTPR